MKNKNWGKLKDQKDQSQTLSSQIRWQTRTSTSKQEVMDKSRSVGRNVVSSGEEPPPLCLLTAAAAGRGAAPARGTQSLQATWGATRPLAPPANELLSWELERRLHLLSSLLFLSSTTYPPRMPARLPSCRRFALNALISGFERSDKNLELASDMSSSAMFLLASPKHHLGG